MHTLYDNERPLGLLPSINNVLFIELICLINRLINTSNAEAIFNNTWNYILNRYCLETLQFREV